MFIYNLKINSSKFFKVIFVLVCVSIVILFCTAVYRVMFESIESTKIENEVNTSVNNIKSSNYTSVLKTVHENIDQYVGQKICFTGYIYRVYDIKDNQFILARDMIVSSDFQSVVVGFLCEYDKAKNFENDTWVEVTGEIIKGDYHGDMPIVKISKISKVNAPKDEFVYPPDGTYIPTNNYL